MPLKLLSLSRSMPARDPAEGHRPATPLELLFDLVSVIAIAAAAAGLHHAIAEAHYVQGLISFSAAFFMVWWAWMNFTWFASAYDNDDVIFRLLTMLSMAGCLTIAAGVSPFFKSQDLTLILAGFVIMRIAMIAFWLRAALHDSDSRKTALAYAVGIALAQIYWVVLVLNQPNALLLFSGLFVIGVVIEISVPYLAERHGATPWHRHHMIERFGLLNIIVLGETLLAATHAIHSTAGGHVDIASLKIALSALVIVFALWWLYFSKEDHLQERSKEMAFTWGYGHLLIYMAGAAAGAGFAVLVDIATDHSHIPALIGLYAVAAPVALYLLGLWLVRDRYAMSGGRHVLPVFAILILGTPLLLPVEGIALVAVLSVLIRSRLVTATNT